jgi:uncharacterized protein (TIGR02271 family)
VEEAKQTTTRGTDMAVGTNTRTYEDWIGLDAYDRGGERIGEITNVFLDTDTGRPEWVTIKTGWFGMNSSFAPIVGSTTHEEGIRLDVDKDVVKDSPQVGDAGALDADEERRLYEHYHIDTAAGRDAYVTEERTRYGYDISRRADEGYDIDLRDEAAMTRREEEVDVGTRREETGRVRLRKYVTTEQETVTVPVEKERVVVETEPAHGTSTTGDLRDEEAEIVVHEDKVDVDKRVVDKETVRAGKEKISEAEKVQADVRKEHIDVEGDAERR